MTDTDRCPGLTEANAVRPVALCQSCARWFAPMPHGEVWWIEPAAVIRSDAGGSRLACDNFKAP
jgi:hypothetical protein